MLGAFPTLQNVLNKLKLLLPLLHLCSVVRRKKSINHVSVLHDLKEQCPCPGADLPVDWPHCIRSVSGQIQHLHRCRLLHIIVSNGICETLHQRA